MARKTQEYKAVHNFFKNTQKLTKEELREIVREVIREEVKQAIPQVLATRSLREHADVVAAQARQAVVRSLAEEFVKMCEFQLVFRGTAKREDANGGK